MFVFVFKYILNVFNLVIYRLIHLYPITDIGKETDKCSSYIRHVSLNVNKSMVTEKEGGKGKGEEGTESEVAKETGDKEGRTEKVGYIRVEENIANKREKIKYGYREEENKGKRVRVEEAGK